MPDPPQPTHPLPNAAPVEAIQPGLAEASSPPAPLERRTSRLAKLALTRSTDAHPPHHAHFDMPEGGPGTPVDAHHYAESPLHEPHHRRGSEKRHKPVIDIEHVPVDDDPRDWPDSKKNFVMVLLTVSVVCESIGEAEKYADQAAWTADRTKYLQSGHRRGAARSECIFNANWSQYLNVYLVSGISSTLQVWPLTYRFQGCVPVLWASIAEITGRKIVYLVSYAVSHNPSVISPPADN